MNPSHSPLEKGGSKGGFDAVIGNPPYGAWFVETENAYFSQKFKAFAGVKDVYALFMEHGIALLKDKGHLSFIVPSAWTGGPSYLLLRQIILKNQIEQMIMLPFNVFESAYIDTLIFVATKQTPPKTHAVNSFIYPKKEKITSIQLDSYDYSKVQQKSWVHFGDMKIILDPHALTLSEKLRESTKIHFSDKIKIKRGVLFNKELLTPKKSSDKYYRYFEGDVYRYITNEVLNSWVEFGPNLKECPKEFDWFKGKRILLRRLVNRQQRLMASLADRTFITNKNLYTIKPVQDISHEALLGILNSKLISYLYLHQVSQATKDDFPQVTIKDILNLPFPDVESHSKKLKTIEGNVTLMIDLNRKLEKARTPHDIEHIERQIKATDSQIDRLVYELYGLTEEEIRVVEGE